MSEPPPEPDRSYLLPNLIGFARHLRRIELSIGPRQTLDFLRALEWVELSDRQQVYNAAQATLVNRVSDLELFKRAFREYWSGAIAPSDAPGQPSRREPAGPPGASAEEGGSLELGAVADDQGVEGGDGEAAKRSYSAVELLRSKDFSDLDEWERRTLHWMIAELSVSLAKRRSRRWRAGGGERVDFRRSLRVNLRYGGEWLTWAHRRPRIKERPLVVLADVSGSMELYTRVLLQFVYGITRAHSSSVEVFVFGTRLTRITRALSQGSAGEALAQIADRVPDWSGGTRIGRALREFNLDWARRVLGRGAVVLLISDGWDRGDPEELRRQMARLGRSAERLIWLNPLLGSEDYEPLTRGMQAALPHVDDFLPVHNFASLERLAERLMSLEPRRGGVMAAAASMV